METTRSPRFLGTPTLHLPCSQTPAGPSMSGHYNMSVLPPPLRQQRLPLLVQFRGSMTRLLQSLSTLRRLGHPSATQDSLLAADHALPGGIGYPQGYSKRFQKFYISSSFSRLILALRKPTPSRRRLDRYFGLQREIGGALTVVIGFGMRIRPQR